MGLLSNRVSRESLKPGDHIYSWRAAYIYAHHGIYIGDNKVVHFTRQGREVGTGTFIDVLLISSGSSSTVVACPTCTPPIEGHGVMSSCLDCFLSGGILYRFEYNVNPAFFIAKARGGTCTQAVADPEDLVVHRAKYLLENGFGCYNVFKNNCEDFAIYCKTGLLVLDQEAIGEGGQAALIIGGRLAASIVGGRLAAIIATPLRLIKKRLLDQGAIGAGGQAAAINGSLVAIISAPLRLVSTNVYGMAASAVVVYCTSRYAADIGSGMRKDVVNVSVEELTRRLSVGT